MAASSKIRRQTVNFNFPENTVAGTFTRDFELDSDYKVATAVIGYENSIGGLSGYKVGLKTNPGGVIIQEPTNKKDWMEETTVAIEQRGKKLGENGSGIEAKGQKYSLTVVIPDTVDSDTLDFDLVFVLEN